MSVSTYSTYLTFDGNCREAFEFYRAVFGGDFHVFSTFGDRGDRGDGGDGPADEGFAEADKNKVMHVSLSVGDGVLMGSDNSSHGPPLAVGNNFSLSVSVESATEGDALLAALAAGGTVTMPMETTFWGAYFGMCTDKFGINWMVVHEQAGE